MRFFVLGLGSILLAMPARAETIAVRAGGDLQAALDRARPGDVIQLEPGAAFAGPFHLPQKSGDAWITIRSGAAEAALPRPGVRARPSDSKAMPKLTAASDWVVAAQPGAHHYRFVGIELEPSPGAFLYNLVLLGDGKQAAEGLLPHDIVFDRCLLHGDPQKGSRRGIALNGRNISVLHCYFRDFKEMGAESQAVMGWNGPGPFHILDNHLEAAGENILFGGADPAIPGLVPSDIEIRRNHVVKPLAWKQNDPVYAGRHWLVKNLLELKNARRVRVEGNVFECNWADGQDGFAILFTPRNQNGGAPWTVVEDVVFENNIVRHSAGGINILGRDNNHPSRQTRNIVIRNNLFDDLSGKRWGGAGSLLQMLDGAAGVVIDHNTGMQTAQILLADGRPHAGLRFTGNIVRHNAYGIAGSGTSPGRQTLERYFPGAVFEGNILIGGGGFDYPGRNQFPGSVDAVGFADPSSGDYRLSGASRYRRAGAGADFDRLEAATAGVLQP
jgi:hypothetical protein